MIEQRILLAIETFHEKRIEKIKKNETPKSFLAGGKITIHLIPVEAFTSAREFDLSIYANKLDVLRPSMSSDPFNQDYNFDGMINYIEGERNKCLVYVQLFRTGIIEWVNGYYLDENKAMPIYSIEQEIVARTREYLSFQKSLGIAPSIIFYLDFLGTRGRLINLPGGHPIEEDDLIFPPVTIVDLEAVIENTLRLRFDQLWNASGQPRSLHYDAWLKWIKDPK
jgi:hypothetical protein